MHSLLFVLFHIAWEAPPMDHVDGVWIMCSERSHLVKIRLRQFVSTVLDFVVKCDLILRVVFLEDLADSLVDL